MPVRAGEQYSSSDSVNPATTTDGSSFTLPSHPLGIKPGGNALDGKFSAKWSSGVFKNIEDEVILLILESFSPKEILKLGQCCKFLYAFSHHDELWRSVSLRQFSRAPPDWRGSWRSTVMSQPNCAQFVDCDNVYSDELYRPFQCSQVPLTPFAEHIPSKNRILRCSSLSEAEFSADHSNSPFILENGATQWPVSKQWTTEGLLKLYADTTFRAEAVDWTLLMYTSYMQNNIDESPLYLFDSHFVRKTGITVGGPDQTGDYWAPECFGADLFNVLGQDRPDSRWLIVGPTRSGSTFHKDPNATSAWNTVIQGSKYWLMFPPSVSPPGTYVSADGSSVTSPLSVTEYLLTFHKEARQTTGCKEGVCRAHEVVHVPSGWWHLVVNLEDTVAITQNFVTERNLFKTVEFLRDKPEQVSGFSQKISDPYALFMQRLNESRPFILQDLSMKKKRKWRDLIRDSPDGDEDDIRPNGFSFGFVATDNDEIP